MVEVRKTILAVAAVLIAAAGAHGELISVSADAASTMPSHSLTEAESREILLFGFSDEVAATSDLGAHARDLTHEAQASTDETTDSQQAIALKDGRGSLDMCLYALIGLGVFRSGHWVRRASFGFIPEWYHSGAPQQIGHSHAVGPDAYCHADLCFVQPDVIAEELSPHVDWRAFASLVRESQCTPTILACRPPPSMS